MNRALNKTMDGETVNQESVPTIQPSEAAGAKNQKFIIWCRAYFEQFVDCVLMCLDRQWK